MGEPTWTASRPLIFLILSSRPSFAGSQNRVQLRERAAVDEEIRHLRAREGGHAGARRADALVPCRHVHAGEADPVLRLDGRVRRADARAPARVPEGRDAAKKKQAFDASEWTTVTTKVAETPQQHNGCDCGVFTCMGADHIANGEALNYSQDDMPHFRCRMMIRILQGKL